MVIKMSMYICNIESIQLVATLINRFTLGDYNVLFMNLLNLNIEVWNKRYDDCYTITEYLQGNQIPPKKEDIPLRPKPGDVPEIYVKALKEYAYQINESVTDEICNQDPYMDSVRNSVMLLKNEFK